MLVGGFNPSEKYESQLGVLLPIYGKSKKSCSKPPTRMCSYVLVSFCGFVWNFWVSPIPMDDHHVLKAFKVAIYGHHIFRQTHRGISQYIG